ncbi:MAG: hypothetical protein AAGJ94_03520 [Pseudomonadota bacterium]
MTIPFTVPRNASTRSTVLTLMLLALGSAPFALTATPAAAQTECEPGAFGEVADFTVSKSEDKRVTAVSLEYQCGDTLSDGTFIPTGYRLYLEGECGEGACNYPTLMAMPTAREGQLTASYVQDGKDVTVRMRKSRRGVNLNVMAREPRRGRRNGGDGGGRAKPERANYRLSPAS